MPVEFLTQAQKERHGRFIDEPSPEQARTPFSFRDDVDHTLIARKRGAHNRLGFAIQLGTVRHLGAFLPNPIDVPRPVVTYVGRQLHLDSSTSLLRLPGAQTDTACPLRRNPEGVRLPRL